MNNHVTLLLAVAWLAVLPHAAQTASVCCVSGVVLYCKHQSAVVATETRRFDATKRPTATTAVHKSYWYVGGWDCKELELIAWRHL
jgi:hypothetical protein